jgi:hypothetical protein
VVKFKYEIDINCKFLFPSKFHTYTFLGDDFSICVISTIELSLSIMCVCFPAVKLFLNAQFPKYFGSSRTGVGARGSLHLSGSDEESQTKSMFRTLRSKISKMFGTTHVISSSKAHSPPWTDEASTQATAVVSMPRIGLQSDHSMGNSSVVSSRVEVEMDDIHVEETPSRIV